MIVNKRNKRWYNSALLFRVSGGEHIIAQRRGLQGVGRLAKQLRRESWMVFLRKDTSLWLPIAVLALHRRTVINSGSRQCLPRLHNSSRSLKALSKYGLLLSSKLERNPFQALDRALYLSSRSASVFIPRKFDFFQDTRNALVATMIPGGAAVAAFALFAKDKEVVDWWATVSRLFPSEHLWPVERYFYVHRPASFVCTDILFTNSESEEATVGAHWCATLFHYGCSNNSSPWVCFLPCVQEWRRLVFRCFLLLSKQIWSTQQLRFRLHRHPSRLGCLWSQHDTSAHHHSSC